MNLLSTIPMMLASGPPSGSIFGMPPQASTVAHEVDWVYDALTWIMWAFFIVIVVVMVYFMFKYRRVSHVADTGGPTHNTPLEVTWTVIPLILVIGIFYIGLKGYVHLTTPPENSYRIDVIAKRWDWTFKYANGAAENGELHVPVNRPVVLAMTSLDVLHAPFIPAFRVKQDVVPGKMTYLWFEATHTGAYPLYCAEYCGRDHSLMRATVHVYEPDEFQVKIDEAAKWIDKVPDDKLHLAGVLIYNQCSSCHTLDGNRLIGPSFKETFEKFKKGDTRALKGGGSVKVDSAYLEHSIMQPLDQIAMETGTSQPYPPSMTVGIGQLLGERRVKAMVQFIEHLDEVAPGGKLIGVKREDIVVKDAPDKGSTAQKGN